MLRPPTDRATQAGAGAEELVDLPTTSMPTDPQADWPPAEEPCGRRLQQRWPASRLNSLPRRTPTTLVPTPPCPCSVPVVPTRVPAYTVCHFTLFSVSSPSLSSAWLMVAVGLGRP